MSKEASATSAAFLKALDDAIGNNDEAQEVTSFIDSGHQPLNAAMSGRPDGGYPMGRLTEIFGPSSAGKTILATQAMINAQEAGGVAIFIDWERSFDVGLAANMGLNIERPHWIYKRPKTWEEGNMYSARAAKAIRDAKIIDPCAPIIAVHDSIASAIPNSVMYDAKGNVKEIDSYTMNDTTALARVASTTLKVMAQHAAEQNAAFLYLNQIRMKPGVVYGDPTTTPGGNAMEFYSTVRLSLSRETLTEGIGKDKEFAGQKINIKVQKSKLTKPFSVASLRMMYDDNGIAYFDSVWSCVEFLITKKAISMSGSFAVWVDGSKSYPKMLAKKLASDPAGLSTLNDLVTATLTK